MEEFNAFLCITDLFFQTVLPISAWITVIVKTACTLSCCKLPVTVEEITENKPCPSLPTDGVILLTPVKGNINILPQNYAKAQSSDSSPGY